MRILLVASNTDTARELHQKLLSYRGIYWDLRHVKDWEDAILALLKEAYDIVLLKLQGDELVEGKLATLLQSTTGTPFVAILPNANATSELQWIRQGIDDVIREETLTSNYLMRRMRMSLARSERQQAEHRHAVEKMVHHRSRIGAPSLQPQTNNSEFSTSNTPTGYHEPHERFTSNAWPEAKRDENVPLSVAILKEKGTSRLFEFSSDPNLPQANIEVFRNLRMYRETLENNPGKFDVCVVEQDFFEREGAQEFDHNIYGFPAPPMILVSMDRSDVSAVTHILNGFDDCIPIQSATTQALLRSSHFSIERWKIAKEQVRQQVERSPDIQGHRIDSITGSDRRMSTRYLVTRPLLAIPVLVDGSPDKANIREAYSLDFSIDGIGLQVSSQGDIPARNWVVGVECDPQDGSGIRFYYSNVTVRSVSYPQGGIRLGTQFNKGMNNMLAPEFLLPKFNPLSGQFQHPISPNAIEQWIELGVFKPKLLHRVLTCPECSGTATLGTGCSECGSPDIQFTELIHHFACAHFAETKAFQKEDIIRCPKCLIQPLVIGVDFEIIRSHYECLDCNHQGSDLANVGTCLHCRLRFAEHLAEEKEVYGYDVDRMDILAVINSAN